MPPFSEQFIDRRSTNNSASGWRTGEYLILEKINPITMTMDPTIIKKVYIVSFFEN
jgi:hypothetical protein